jgi:hypothetical protein
MLRAIAKVIAAYMSGGAFAAAVGVLVLLRGNQVGIGYAFSLGFLGFHIARGSLGRSEFADQPIFGGRIPFASKLVAALLCLMLVAAAVVFVIFRKVTPEFFWASLTTLVFDWLALSTPFVCEMLFRIASGLDLEAVARLELTIRRSSDFRKFLPGRSRLFFIASTAKDFVESRITIDWGERRDEALRVVQERTATTAPRLSPTGDYAVADGFLKWRQSIEAIVKALRDREFPTVVEPMPGR